MIERRVRPGPCPAPLPPHHPLVDQLELGRDKIRILKRSKSEWHPDIDAATVEIELMKIGNFIVFEARYAISLNSMWVTGHLNIRRHFTEFCIDASFLRTVRGSSRPLSRKTNYRHDFNCRNSFYMRIIGRLNNLSTTSEVHIREK